MFLVGLGYDVLAKRQYGRENVPIHETSHLAGFFILSQTVCMSVALRNLLAPVLALWCVSEERTIV